MYSHQHFTVMDHRAQYIKAAYLAFEVDWFEDVLLTNGANVVPTLQQLVSATDPVVQLQGGKFNNGTVSFSRYNMGSLFVRCVGLNVQC